MKDALASLFRDDGKTVILPIDHGTAVPVPGLERPGELVRSLQPAIDGLVVNYGLGRAYRTDLEGVFLCLRADLYKPDVSLGSVKLFGAEEALEIGARALMHMLYPGHADEGRIVRECARTIRQGIRAGLPTIVEALPVGLGLPESYTVPAISFAVRQAGELGAAVVKTAFPPGASTEEFRAIVEASLVPVIVLGGAPMGDDRALLAMVRSACDAGASGIAIGRNVWAHPDPVRIAHQLSLVVHGNAAVEEALEMP